MKSTRRNEFVNRIALMSSVSEFDDPFFKKTKTASTQRTDADEGSWVTYEAYIRDVGPVIGDESIRTKTVTTCMSKKLRADHKIAWPYCLEVENVNETFANRRTSGDKLTIGGQKGISGEEAAGLEKLFDVAASSTGWSGSSAGGAEKMGTSRLFLSIEPGVPIGTKVGSERGRRGEGEGKRNRRNGPLIGKRDR